MVSTEFSLFYRLYKEFIISSSKYSFMIDYYIFT
nr:MAG TPA: hypothetical protein [Caudoviricetes sp.]